MTTESFARLEEIYRNSLALPFEVDRDLDRVLVHEIYGHALPYLLAGHLSGRCADPQPHQRATDACSIRRENAVPSSAWAAALSTASLDWRSPDPAFAELQVLSIPRSPFTRDLCCYLPATGDR